MITKRNLEMNAFTSLFGRFYLWQICIAISIILLGLGFTGQSMVAGYEIIEGKENLAIGVGVCFFILGCVFRLVPMPASKDKDD